MRNIKLRATHNLNPSEIIAIKYYAKMAGFWLNP